MLGLATGNQFICVHGHFYQPARENPWTQSVDPEPGACPYHDWNQKITAECYAPNAAARILGPGGRVEQLFNNYQHMSFDFGPTLLAWLARNAPVTYQQIVESDRAGQTFFSGHGPALAQCYSHIIMPLANRRDKETQVRWGIADFEYRYQRRPEGIWLPETAVDLETLDIIAEQGLDFMILAPHQARRVRAISRPDWQPIQSAAQELSRPCQVNLQSGRKLAAFFYDSAISAEIAFGRLTEDGISMARRLTGTTAHIPPQVVHLTCVAADGETFGHHRRFGEMALASCLRSIMTGREARLTVFAEHLEFFPPTHEVEIIENSSWSCQHGIARWQDDCGDDTGAHPDWHQAWRRPLRRAMNWLRDRLADVFEDASSGLLRDPWQARNDYSSVLLRQSDSSIQDFFAAHAARKLSGSERTRVLRLLEMQLCAMQMFSSCGWFFDDISGIESVQVLRYAARAIQLARQCTGSNLEPEYLDFLAQAPSNVPEFGTGAGVYQRLVRPVLRE